MERSVGKIGRNVLGCKVQYDYSSSLYLNVGKFIYSFISIESYEHHEPSRAEQKEGSARSTARNVRLVANPGNRYGEIGKLTIELTKFSSPRLHLHLHLHFPKFCRILWRVQVTLCSLTFASGIVPSSLRTFLCSLRVLFRRRRNLTNLL
jgi:hypothetical protein